MKRRLLAAICRIAAASQHKLQLPSAANFRSLAELAPSDVVNRQGESVAGIAGLPLTIH
jgi:hypothetical protein